MWLQTDVVVETQTAESEIRPGKARRNARRGRRRHDDRYKNHRRHGGLRAGSPNHRMLVPGGISVIVERILTARRFVIVEDCMNRKYRTDQEQ